MKLYMLVSIITATYNGIAYTKTYFESLIRNITGKENYEVIFIDDSSCDGTREFLKELEEKHKNVRVHLNEENQGYAKNNNLGAKLAQGEHLVFLNNDLVLTENWLEPMLEVLEKEEKVGAVGNVQLRAAPPHKLDHTGMCFRPNGRASHIRIPPPKGKDYSEHRAITAACMIMKKEVFEEIGGFDKGYINGTEDTDLCVRLCQKGYRQFVAHKSVIYHHVSVSPGRKNKERERANNERFLKKWGLLTKKWGREECGSVLLRSYLRKPWKLNYLFVGGYYFIMSKFRERGGL